MIYGAAIPTIRIVNNLFAFTGADAGFFRRAESAEQNPQSARLSDPARHEIIQLHNSKNFFPDQQDPPGGPPSDPARQVVINIHRRLISFAEQDEQNAADYTYPFFFVPLSLPLPSVNIILIDSNLVFARLQRSCQSVLNVKKKKML